MPGNMLHARGRKAAGERLAALIVVQALCAGTAWPQGPAAPPPGDELTKQDRIYRSQGKDVPGGYVTTRSLAGYTELLPSGFRAALGRLGPSDRWLDVGAGGGQAILDYYALDPGAARPGKRARAPGRAKAVAVSIEDRRTERWHKRAAEVGEDQLRYFFGKRFREYTREELGSFRMITDVYGGFSYTEHLSQFLERVLDVLAVNGSFYTMVQSVHLQDGKDNPKTWYLTELVDTQGRDVTVCSWLKSVSCTRVSCESKSDWDAPTELIHVRKVCGAVRVPALKLLQYEAGQPPGRRFQLVPRQGGPGKG